ncbi:MAG: OmpH family outer membrane protein [Chromatiales bacterium]|nr:OmpH family outer membrane protein [Chromatiales bacterium]
MTTWRKLALASLLGVLLLPPVADAQTGANIRIGFVDLNRLVSESPQAEAATRQLEEEFGQRQREFITRETAYNERIARLQRDVEVMGAEERRNAELELRRDERDLVRMRDELREDINIRTNEALRKLQIDAIEETRTYARRANYDLVLIEGVVFFSDAVDITDRVLEGLQERFRASRGN